MKKTINSSITLLFILLVISCGPSIEEKRQEITNLETEMKSKEMAFADTVLTTKAVSSYLDFVTMHPSDSLSPVYLFKAGNISAQKGDVRKATEIFEKLVSEYPEHKDAPMALFLQGFIHETMSSDFKAAKVSYERFLKMFPKHERASDVRFSLDNLGKSPEELLNQMNIQDSLSS